MTTITFPQGTMIEHLIATTAKTVKDTGTALTLRQESDRLFIIDSTEDHETTPLFTVTRGQLFTAIEQWADEAIKWFEDEFPPSAPGLRPRGPRSAMAACHLRRCYGPGCPRVCRRDRRHPLRSVLGHGCAVPQHRSGGHRR